MVDTRFHTSSGPILLRALLASLATPPLVDDSRLGSIIVTGVDELDRADETELALATRPAYRDALRDTSAGVVVVHPSLRDFVPRSALAIIDERAHELFVDLLEKLYPAGTRGAALSQFDEDGPDTLVESDVRLGENVVIGPNVEIGRNTVIGPNTVIGRGVTIGRNAVIGANVTVEYAHLGNNVVLHPGVRVGAEGFGWLSQGRANRKIPQLGRVIIQDGVEIGANTTIDRGALGDTVIGEGTKIDNLVQIGHNCRIGRRCLIAGTCGIGGSTIIGDHVLVGGGSGTVGHLTIGTGSVLSARCLVTKDVPAGQHVAGQPAQELRAWQRETAMLRRLSKRGLE
jgi:UDP-3-O-[3-hydroxymyristoyl] glucosamine N-acyltransferase